MTTIFPAPGTITTNNSYILDWYLYEKPALQHPTLVKARTDSFASIEQTTDSPNLETYSSSVYGSTIVNVTTQTLEYSTINTSTASWYIFDNNILSYTINQLTTITLYFTNKSAPYIPFKTNSIVRVSSKIYGYLKTFTVLEGTSNSIKIQYDSIPPESLTIDNIIETVYYQSRVSIEPTASIPRQNLNYSKISPYLSPSIRIPDTYTLKDTHADLKFFRVNTQTAISVFRDVSVTRTADKLTTLKIETKSVEFDNIPKSLSTYANDSAGHYFFNIVSQTPSYITVNTTTVSWYSFDNDILSYTTEIPTTTTIYFNNQYYAQIVPFPVGSTVRIKNILTNYSNTFTVIKSSPRSVTIAYTEFQPYGATIDNIYETVYYQSNVHNEKNVSTNRLNLNYSIRSPNSFPSIQLPGKETMVPVDESKLKLSTVGKDSAITVFKEVTVNRTADKLNNLKTEIKPVEFDSTPLTLPTYFSQYAGHYFFDIVSQTLSYITVNTTTLSWYSFDNDILAYTTEIPTTTTIYFNNQYYAQIAPFPVGSTIRIKNKFSTYSTTATVLKSNIRSVTVAYIEFEPYGATIDNMYETIYYQTNTLRDLNSSTTTQRNFLKSLTPAISPSIIVPYAESFNEVRTVIKTNTLEKPVSVMREITAKVNAEIVNKAKITTAEVITTVSLNKLETHTAPVTGEFTFLVKSRNVDLETYNTNVVDWYLFDSTLTYSVRQATSITMYFDTPYIQFIPFPTNSTVRITNKYWYSQLVTVLNGTTNSITIEFIPDLPFNLYISNLTETVYNQDHTYLSLPAVSDSRKKLLYSTMGGGLTNLPVDNVKVSVNDSLVNSGNIAKQIANISTVISNISSAVVDKQLFKLSGDIDNLDSSNIEKLKVKDNIITATVDESHQLTHYDSLVDGLFVYVDGQPIQYNVVNWYINDLTVLSGSYVSSPVTTLIFSTTSLWKLFLENQYVRIKQLDTNYSKDVLVLSSTLHSITFTTPNDFPNNYTGMTINHLYSPVYSQSLVDVVVNPPNLTLPRENLAAASNVSFLSFFPISKLIYNSRGVNSFITLSNDLSYGFEVSSSANLNSYDSIKSGLEKYVVGQPIDYKVANWYINDIDNRFIGTIIISNSTTLFFENTGVLHPFLKNQYVRIEQSSTGFNQDVLVLSSTSTSITFETINSFPTSYTGMKISQLYSSVYYQLLADTEYAITTNSTNLELPRENLAASKSSAFISLFPVSKLLYNTRGTYAVNPYIQIAGSTNVVDTAKTLNPYTLIEDGLFVYVDGQPIFYNVVSWYINDTDNRLLGSLVSGSSITLMFNNIYPSKLFYNGYYVRITQSNFSSDVLITASTLTSITFNTVENFPTNYSGMKINRLYSSISKQSVVDEQFSILINPTNLTTPQENLAASLLKPNSRGSQIVFGGIERFSNFTVDSDIISRGRLEVFDDTRLPGDFDTTITSSTLSSYTVNSTTSDWYMFDQDILSYDTVTLDFVTLRFNDYGFIPFKTGSTVKIITNNVTFFATVFNGSSSYITINHQNNTILSNTRIQQDTTSVYPQNYVVTTVGPVSPKENLYYMRLRSLSPLGVYFQQPSSITTVPSLSKQVSIIKGDSSLGNQRGAIDQYQVNTITTVDSRSLVNSLSNVTVLKPVTPDTLPFTLTQLPKLSGEVTEKQNGIVDKFTVNRISEIGRETVITIPSTKVLPIQFWN